MDILPDVQKTKPEIPILISRVGVQNVELPFLLNLRNGGVVSVLAMTTMICELDENERGISMSRFIRTLRPHLNYALRRISIEEILKDLSTQLESQKVSIKFEFKIPVVVKSPITNNEFPQYYKCSFRSDYSHGYFQFYENVRVQYSAYCPCSAELCASQSIGYPHNQRAFADVLVQTNRKRFIWLEDLIDLVDEAVVTKPYPIIQRPDEAWIAIEAEKHPQFVEDSIRSISIKLDRLRGVVDWYVKCTHEESIHTSDAIAINWKGVPGGFSEITYI